MLSSLCRADNQMLQPINMPCVDYHQPIMSSHYTGHQTDELCMQTLSITKAFGDMHKLTLLANCLV